MTQGENNFGKPVNFEIGDIIYKQGSESTGVYMLLDGQVEIWRHDGEHAHHLASIGAGELLGEVSVIEQSHHSVTAKASQPTNALLIEGAAFRKSFSDPLVRHVVNTLAARLRSSYSISKTLQEESPDGVLNYKSKHPTIEGISRMVADKFLSYVEIKEFPFSVGNIASRVTHSISTANSLRIPLKGTPELADGHFEIIKRDGELCLRDLGGPHGTIVNGEALSRYSLMAIAKLKYGRNEVVAGGPESPVRFAITVPRE